METDVNISLRKENNNMLKFSDIMLDLDTGDASMHDVYAKEALNKVKVASAIFEYAATLSEMSSSRVVQEAVEESDSEAAADLPTDPAEGPALATEAVQQQLGAFYDVLVENAKKVNAAAKRDMAAFIGLGKKYGVSAAAAKSGSFRTSFAAPIAQALTREFAKSRKVGNSIKFKKGVFPSASECEKLIFGYGNAMASLGAVFGLDISECIEDPTVRDVLGLNKNFVEMIKGTARLVARGDRTATGNPVAGFSETSGDLGKMYKNLMRGTNYNKFEMGKLATTKSASTNDITWLITYIYVALQVSKGIVDAAKGAGKKKEAMEFVAQVCAADALRHSQSDEKGQKKISENLTKLNDSMTNWAADVEKVSDLVVKGFSDATSALGKVATGEAEGLVDEGGSAESGETAGDSAED